MKKLLTLSGVLLLAVLISITAFAAPEMAQTIQTQQETDVDGDIASSASVAQEGVVVTYQVCATPHYCINGVDTVLEGKLYFELVNGEGVPATWTADASAVGVAPEDADDCFLAHFRMTVTVDGNGKIASVLNAENLMKKKTVTDIELCEVTSNKAGSYYTGTNSKLLSGKMIADGEEIYVFNAPETYINPEYAFGSDDALKYLQRNDNNILMIEYNLEYDGGVEYYLANCYNIVTPGVEYDFDDDSFKFNVKGYDGYGEYSTEEDPYFTLQAEELVQFFQQIYYGGLYEADLYDVNGDGVYEYINYKPYSLFYVDSDTAYDFTDSANLPSGTDFDPSMLPYIYTTGTNVFGEEFEDGDLVVGYIDEYTLTVKIASVIKPVSGKITKINGETRSITLSGGEKLTLGASWRLLSNILPVSIYDIDFLYNDVVYKDSFEEFTLTTALTSELMKPDLFEAGELEFYTYGGEVLYYEKSDNTPRYEGNLIIPLDINGNTPEKMFNVDLGGKRIWYIYAYVDGELKYVPVKTEDVQPEIIFGSEINREYNGQLCTYTIDEDGLYEIKSFGFDVDDMTRQYSGMYNDHFNNAEYKKDGIGYVRWDDDRHVLNTDDESKQYIVVEENGVRLEKVAGTRFVLDGATELDRDLVITPETRIIINQWNMRTEKYEIVEFCGADILASNKGSAAVPFDTVTYIVGNDPNSRTKENLLVMYATTEEEFAFETLKPSVLDSRIVSQIAPGLDENGYYRNYYSLFNPFTGIKEYDIPGDDTARSVYSLSSYYETGDVVRMANGMVYEDDECYGKINTEDAHGQVWISSYTEIAQGGIIEIVPTEVTKGVESNAEFIEAIENYSFGGYESNFDNEEYWARLGESIIVEITDDTKFSVLSYPTLGTAATKWGSITSVDKSVLTDTTKRYMCYYDKFLDPRGNFITKYAPYLKAYVCYTEPEDEDEGLPTADFVLVVATTLSSDELGMLNGAATGSYNVIYDANGGENAPANQTKAQGVSVKLSANAPTREGYNFLGWSTVKNGKVEYAPGADYAGDANLVLYAVWTPATYTVTYDANGGENAPASMIKDAGEDITLSILVPEREGYIFRGWATSADGKAVYAPGTAYTKDEDITLYAVWEEIVEEPIDPNAPFVSATHAKAAAGKKAVVSINLKNNPGLAGLTVKVTYDSAITLESVTRGDALEDMSFIESEDINENPYTLLWFEADNHNSNGCLATLTFNVPEATPLGVYGIEVYVGNEGASNADREFIRVGTENGSVEVVDVVMGDVTGDARVNIQDVILLAQYSAGWESAKNDMNAAAADVNADGRINIQDVIRLAQYCAGWNVTLG